LLNAGGNHANSLGIEMVMANNKACKQAVLFKNQN
jgi:hypothetical protein